MSNDISISRLPIVFVNEVTEPEPESSLQKTQVIEALPEEHVHTRKVKPPETKTELDPDISNLVMEKLQSSAEEDEEPLTMHIWDFAGHELYYTTHQVTSCSY